jgi:hypothetical protein
LYKIVINRIGFQKKKVYLTRVSYTRNYTQNECDNNRRLCDPLGTTGGYKQCDINRGLCDPLGTTGGYKHSIFGKFEHVLFLKEPPHLSRNLIILNSCSLLLQKNH